MATLPKINFHNEAKIPENLVTQNFSVFGGCPACTCTCVASTYIFVAMHM